MIETAQPARQKSLSAVAGTQCQHSKKCKEIIRRLHDGQIGDIVEQGVHNLDALNWAMNASKLGLSRRRSMSSVICRSSRLRFRTKHRSFNKL